jgi:hypothetical protein
VDNLRQRTERAIQVLKVRCICRVARRTLLIYTIRGAPQSAIIAEVQQRL